MEEPTTYDMVVDEEPKSVLDLLAEKRRLVADTKETYIPVPGYDASPPVLMVKYRLLDGKEINAVAEQAAKVIRDRWERQLHAAVSVFIKACSGLYIDLQDGTEPQPLTINGAPVLGFTHALADALGFADKIDNPDRALDVVFGLFGNNEVAITQHSYKLNRWMGDTTVDVNAELLGNL